MKLKNIYLIGVLFFIATNAFSQSASSHISKAKKAYSKGDYVEASFQSIKALRIKPKKKKPQEILSFSYELAQESIIEKIEDLKSTSINFKGDRTVSQRKIIVKLYKTLIKLDKRSYEITKIVKKSKFNINFDRIDLSEEYKYSQISLKEAKEEAAEMHYAKGLDLMKNDDRESYKKAAKSFKKAKNYIPNYKQSLDLYEEARKNGTTRIAIFAFDNKSGTQNFGAIGESVSDKLNAQLFKNKDAMEFAEIVSRDELGKIIAEHQLNMSADINQGTISEYGKLLGVHIIVTGKITQVSSEHQRVIHDNPYTVQKEVVVGTESYVNSKGKTKSRSVYGVVSASIFESRKSSKAILSGSFKVLDVKTGRILSQDQFSETYNWLNQWVSFKGNIKAINKRDFNNYDANEFNPPTDFEMGNLLVKQLTDKMAKTVTNLLK
ncbi:MAG: CsgG/HfaB family protein [Flavobacteriaceae bacterium]